MKSGILYFFNQNPGNANNNCRLYYDFDLSGSSSSNRIFNISGQNTLSGLIAPSVSNFWTRASGSGYFENNRYIEVQNFSGANFSKQNFTIALIYENLGTGGATLISTLDTGQINLYNNFGIFSTFSRYRGFEFGVTANNKLYFEYYSDNGSNIAVSDFYLGDKNSIFLSVIENELLMGYYNFYRNELIINNFDIQSEYLFDYSGFYIGYNPKAVNTYSFNKSFSGFIDELLIFSPSIYEYDLISLNSGFAYNYTVSTTVTSSSIENPVSGFSTGITGYQSGITGYVLIPTGVVTDQFGLEYTGYRQSGISGSIPMYGFTFLPSSILVGLTGVTENLVYDYNYINSFGKNSVNILTTLDSQDLVEINLISGTGSYEDIFLKNSTLGYQSLLNQFFLKGETSTNPVQNPLIFINGQLILTGDYIVTGNGYNSGLSPLNDYFIDEFNNIIFDNMIDNDNQTVLDYIKDYSTGRIIENFNTGTITGQITGFLWTGKRLNYYINGQKLISGIHYANINNQILFTGASGFTGVFFAVPNINNIRITGSGNIYINQNKYLSDFSEVYRNGLRQKIGVDYLELGRVDTNLGTGFFDSRPDLIYNNDGFFNL